MTITADSPRDLSIIIPFFNEEKSVPSVLSDLDRAFEGFGQVEIIAVDDGSDDGTWQALLDWRPKVAVACVRGFRLLKNEGQNRSLIFGISKSSGRVVLTMDGDGQHPPKIAADLVRNVSGDVVAAQGLRSRGGSSIKEFLSRSYYMLIRKLTGVRLVSGTSEFRAVRGDVYRQIANGFESSIFLRAGVFKSIPYPNVVHYQPPSRVFGDSKFGFRAQLRLAKASLSIFGFALARIVRSWAASVGALGAIYAVYILIVWAGPAELAIGWASTALLISINLLVSSVTIYLGGIVLKILQLQSSQTSVNLLITNSFCVER